MANYVAMSAMYPGFMQGQQQQQDLRLKTGQADDADITRQGQEAFGRTLMSLQQGGGQAPQPPMAQQPMPGGPPQAGPQGPMPQQGPPMGGQPPMPMQGQQPPPMPPQPGAQGGLGPQPPGGGMLGGNQNITWQSVAQKVAQANPGANPRVIAAAVDKFMPIMNQQAQQQWQMMRAQIMQQEAGRRQQQGDARLDIADQNADARADAEARRTQQGNRRLDQGDQRIQGQADEREARGGRFDRREEDRATDRVLKQKKDELTLQLQRERNAIFAGQAGLSTDQLKKRLDEAQKRHEDAKAKLDADPAFKAPEKRQKPAASSAPRAAPTDSFNDRFETPAPSARPQATDGKGNIMEFDGKAWVPAQAPGKQSMTDETPDEIRPGQRYAASTKSKMSPFQQKIPKLTIGDLQGQRLGQLINEAEGDEDLAALKLKLKQLGMGRAANF